MASQGPNNPGTAANNSAVGTRAWTSVNNIFTSAASYATATDSGLGTWSTNYLQASNFGFSIPGGSTITGIEVEIDRSCNGTTENLVPGRTKDIVVSMVKGGTVTGNNYGDTVTL